jgi:hypothetical protein
MVIRSLNIKYGNLFDKGTKMFPSDILKSFAWKIRWKTRSIVSFMPSSDNDKFHHKNLYFIRFTMFRIFQESFFSCSVSLRQFVKVLYIKCIEKAHTRSCNFSRKCVTCKILVRSFPQARKVSNVKHSKIPNKKLKICFVTLFYLFGL